MYAHLVRYEVGESANAEQFVDQVLAQFDAMQSEIPGMLGSFLLTRRDEGEALEITLWEKEADTVGIEEHVRGRPAIAGGAREVMTGRRSDVGGTPLWDVWQGRQEFKST